MTDVAELGQETVSNFLAILPSHDMVLIVAGCPCKDLSRLKGGRKNVDGKRSKLFYQLPRISEIAVKVSNVPVRFLVGNVVCDEEAMTMTEITKELVIRPFSISAVAVSGPSRDRLYWADSVWSLKSGEEEAKNKLFTTIKPSSSSRTRSGWNSFRRAASSPTASVAACRASRASDGLKHHRVIQRAWKGLQRSLRKERWEEDDSAPRSTTTSTRTTTWCGTSSPSLHPEAR